MKKLFKPACILFNILTLILFFFLGLLYAGWVEAGKNQGLAGGAIVLGYGVIFALTALVLSFFTAYYLKHKLIVRINVILGILILTSLLLIKNNADARKKEREERNNIESKKTTRPVNRNRMLALTDSPKRQKPINMEMGLGVFKPRFKDGQAFYFYGNPNLEKSLLEHLPTDSLVFEKTEIGAHTVSQAPPWLMPLHLKMDYGICFFKVISISEEFFKVEGNKSNGYSTYVSRWDGDLIFWPDFLLKVNSIKFLDPANQFVRIKPLNNASPISLDFDYMKPLLINESWVKVALLDSNYIKKGEGWVQWKKERQLLISYSLLS